MKPFVKIGFSLCLFLLLFACKKDNNFPDGPVLEVRSFEKTSNTRAVWKVGFTDGDGDLGTRDTSDAPNFIVTYFAIEDDTLREIEDINGGNYRIPTIDKIRTAAGVEGQLEFRIDTDLYKASDNPVDSILLRAFARDRSNNESNVIETPIFPT